MKSNRVFIILLASLLCINLNAQLFVGGSIGFNASSTNHNGTTSIYKSSNYGITIMPSFGKFLSDKLAVGIDLNISSSGQKSDNGGRSNSSQFGLSPFLRYYAIRWNKFSVFGEGNVGVSFSMSKDQTGGITTDNPKNTSIYFGVHPGLSYDISEKLSLETSIHILSLGCNYFISKDLSSNDKSFNFNLGGGLSNIISVNAITIGGIYKS